jgi:saccharopine dehydrogenase-like NADP-dependent oxidoreductase
MDKKIILILGAGRSSASLIDYLGAWAAKNNFRLCVADIDLIAVEKRTAHLSDTLKVQIKQDNPNQIEELVSTCEIAISLLPPFLHPKVAEACIKHSKNLATASYASAEIKVFDKPAKDKGLTFLFEMGVDPGIDHMSSLKIIDRVKAKGGIPLSFKSFSGALLNKETQKDNPWHYKFTWNPRNVVLAGQGSMARYKLNNKDFFVPYVRLFKETWEVQLHNNLYEAYPNRNSLEYVEQYHLQNIPFLVRGTLRIPGFCEAWNVLIHLGATNNETKVNVANETTVGDYFAKLSRVYGGLKEKEKVEDLIGFSMSDNAWKCFNYLELYAVDTLESGEYTPAMVLEKILLKKWEFKENDKDMVVMYHELDYELNQTKYRITSTLEVEGKDHEHTAISGTVGIPLGIGVRLILEGAIKRKGLVLPVFPEIYEPVLKELTQFEINFTETESRL